MSLGKVNFTGRLLRLFLIALVPVAALAGSAPAKVPDVELIDQDGRSVHLHRDLVKGRLAAFSFVFTSCTTVCAPLGAQVAKIQQELGAAASDISLISVSIDPETDTPEKLKAWAGQFGAAPGWSLLTGKKSTVEELLKQLRVFTPDLQAHTPFLFIVDDLTDHWTRVNPLETPARDVAALLRKMLAERSAAARTPQVSASEHYFGDVRLTDQDGQEVSFYRDLLAGKTVVINTFFSQCSGVCSVTMPLFHKLQEELGPANGNNLQFVSITVDPETDTPAVLKKYAAAQRAGPGWTFLTGDKSAVDLALRKLGLQTESREGHSNVIIVGRDATGLWKKLFGLAASEEIAKSIRGVLDDRP